jgi:uncharacterized membrane protein
MRNAVLVTLLRLSLVVGLFASAALVLDYRPASASTFCGVDSGCAAVRLSPYSHLFNVPLPWLGLLAFGSLFVIALTARSRVQHVAIAALTALGALAAAGLVALQAFTIHAFCTWCLLADASAVVAAISAGLLYAHVAGRARADAPPTPNEARLAALLNVPAVVFAWIGAAFVALAAPAIWASYPPPPPDIVALDVPGKITVVSFTDFECPYCRGLHPTLEELAHERAGQLVLVRKMVPLSGHPGALPAALAHECTPPEQREAMADALYGAPVELLNRQGILALAEAKLGMDRDALGRCMDAPETRARIDADRALFTRIQGPGLPLTYVGSRLVLGFKPDRVRQAVALAVNGPPLGLPLAGMFALVGAALAFAAGITLRSERKLR